MPFHPPFLGDLGVLIIGFFPRNILAFNYLFSSLMFRDFADFVFEARLQC